ncbi:MAG TPA: squalene/phytoene synthase family protein [Thermoanaerobaculia bacterium]|jgi:farnesyl-diphosphate farnesyltransferase
MTDLDELLEKTSRTFALSIPRLPEPTRTEVGVAYLLFRVADTFEDSATWGRRRRIRALNLFCELLEGDHEQAGRRLGRARRWARRWYAEVPIDHAGYQQLMADLPAVLDAFFQLREPARRLVCEHTVRTARGMAGFVERTGEDGELRLADLEDLREYCYVVAGIVGEMLTELFVLERAALAPVAGELRARSRAFGEGLQLVNILKDSPFDADEGRSYLPPGVERGEVLALARRDLDAAAVYVETLREAGAPRGIVGFNALNLLLAFAALDRLEAHGPGAKISRQQVAEIAAALDHALERGLPVLSPA